MINEYRNRIGTNIDGIIRDMLTELIHISDEEGVDFQDRVDAAVAVTAEEDKEDDRREFEVEFYELHASKVRLRAKNKADAILMAVCGAHGDVVDNSLEYIEIAHEYGRSVNASELALSEDEQKEIQDTLSLEPDGKIEGLRSVEEV